MYKCIFFDLDHTLWDYERNSKETLHDIYGEFRLIERNVDFDRFHFRFREVNLQLWDLYDRGLIGSDVIRKERFKQILETFNADDETLSQQLSDSYLQICPEKGNLMPHALETLSYLSAKYNLTVITNGFDEIQHRKLKSANLNHLFDHVITSQRAGHKKPAKEIFEYALTVNNILPSQAIMIGDNLITDIGGARNATIDTVFFNPEEISHDDIVKHEIKFLNELCIFL
jgi:YjjG family noncanonical pyrimidine nucleotidase